MYARTLAMFIIEYLVGTNLAFKNIVLEKLFSHPLLKDVLPPYLQELLKVKTNKNLVENFRFGLTSHLVSAKFSKITMEKNIVCNLATSQSARSSREVAKLLRVDRRNIRRVAERRQFARFIWSGILDISPTC